jgi:pyrroline-5-carboxylate reductase
MKAVCNGIAAYIGSSLIISIAAGINLPDLARWLTHGSNKPSIVRVMPNTPALVGQGATGMYAPASITQSQRDLAFGLLGSISAKSYWVDSEGMLL